VDAAFVGGGRLGRGAILAAAFVNGAVDFAALWGLGEEIKGEIKSMQQGSQ
jgi:hypothetical protein